MSLKDRLKADIRAAGPMGVDRFMAACLHDPKDGYYATRPALGARGDFITAPLVSQMFGELIGAWAVEVWRRMGAPTRLILAEIGPGDGTLMSDALRAARLDPAFIAAADLWLIETSAPLIAAQGERLAGASLAPHWIAGLEGLPTDAPLILIANELLDCLPARQFVRTEDGWAERAVGISEDGELRFGLAPASAAPDIAVLAGEDGAFVETSPAQRAVAGDIAHRIVTQGGAALLIDYGDEDAHGDTLQALQGHQKVDPLACPGEADLTMHADFRAVRAASMAEGAAFAILEQGRFLRRLGIEARAKALAAARPDRAPAIQRQLARLTDADQMGRLFKAACLYSPGQPHPPGFDAGFEDQP
jgi:NADH dehydrogenase [ubiquinone] 1 alpha subcomplex assembly factor 7